MKKHEYLDKIYKLQFFVVDLNLYLDNFPECEKAKADYDKISSELKKTMWDYEKEYGPLTNFGSAYFKIQKNGLIHHGLGKILKGVKNNVVLC